MWYPNGPREIWNKQNIFGASKHEVVGSILSTACIYMNTYTHIWGITELFYILILLCVNRKWININEKKTHYTRTHTHTPTTHKTKWAQKSNRDHTHYFTNQHMQIWNTFKNNVPILELTDTVADPQPGPLWAWAAPRFLSLLTHHHVDTQTSHTAIFPTPDAG